MRKSYLEMLPMSFNAVHLIPNIENEKLGYTWKCFPCQFNAVHSIPGIENEKDIPGNASPVIQCSSPNSRYRK